jgi:hypothetical protein
MLTLQFVNHAASLMIRVMADRRRTGRAKHLLLQALPVAHLTHQRTLLTLKLVQVVTSLCVVNVQTTSVGLVVLVVDLHSIAYA